MTSLNIDTSIWHWPYDTSVQKATSDNENVDAVQRHALDITRFKFLKLIFAVFPAVIHIKIFKFACFNLHKANC